MQIFIIYRMNLQSSFPKSLIIEFRATHFMNLAIQLDFDYQIKQIKELVMKGHSYLPNAASGLNKMNLFTGSDDFIKLEQSKEIQSFSSTSKETSIQDDSRDKIKSSNLGILPQIFFKDARVADPFTHLIASQDCSAFEIPPIMELILKSSECSQQQQTDQVEQEERDREQCSAFYESSQQSQSDESEPEQLVLKLECVLPNQDVSEILTVFASNSLTFEYFKSSLESHFNSHISMIFIQTNNELARLEAISQLKPWTRNRLILEE